MYLSNVLKRGESIIISFLKGFDRAIIYASVIFVPLMIYPLKVNGYIFTPRVIRELAFFSFGIVILTYLQESKWLRYLVIWLVLNWWLNFFSPGESSIYLFNIFSALSIYISIKLLLSRNYIKVDDLMRIICSIVIFQFLWVCMQRFFKYDPIFFPVDMRGFVDTSRNVDSVGWMGNPSLLGVFFATTSFLLLYYFNIKKIPIFFFMVLSSLLFIFNFTTGLSFAVGSLTYCLLRYKRYWKWSLVIIPFLVIAFAIYIKSPNLDRVVIWKKLIFDGIKIRPFVGCGLNTFAHLQIVDKTGTPWFEAHNEYLQMILEIGLIGFLLFCGLVVSKFLYLIKSIRGSKEIAMFSCLVAYLVSAISLFPFHLAQITLPMLIIWACLETSVEKNASSRVSAKCA